MISDQFNIPSGPVLGVHLTVTGQELPAYQPVEGNLLDYVEEQDGIKPGQLCWVGYCIQHVGGLAQMRTLLKRIRPA